MPSPAGQPQDHARNAGIDALRGLSILLVVLHHIGLRIPLGKTALAAFVPMPLLRALNFNGYEAVFIFFVISGFLIAGNIIRRHGSLQNVDGRAFYARRFARIMPCLLALVAVLSALHLAGLDDFIIHRQGQSLGGAVFAALALHLNWYEGVTGYLPGNWDVLWSLSIEEVFYLGFPALCLWLRRDAWLVPGLVTLALSLPWTHAALADNEIWQEKAYLPGMSAIAIGVLGAWLTPHLRLTRVAVVLGLALGWGALLAVFVFGAAVWHIFHDGYLLVLTLGTLTLLIACTALGQGGARPLRGVGLLRSWGRLSYEIYLSHMFVVYATVRAYHAFGSQPQGYLWYLVALPLCWLLGKAIEQGLSLPAERWLKGSRLADRPGLASDSD